MTATVDKEQLGKALGRIATGVYIVTLKPADQAHGILATWVAQVAFEPPAVTISFNKERGILKEIKEGTALSINVLSKDNMDIFKAFARPASGENDDRFAGFELIQNQDAGPVFAKAVSYLNCRVKQLVDAGDHTLALAEVFGGSLLHPDVEPMVHLRKNGFQY